MVDNAPHRQPRIHGYFKIVLEVAVAVVFAVLVWHNYMLRRQLAPAAAVARIARGFVPHDTLTTVPIIEPNGQRGVLDLRQSRTIVAVVDPRCGSCKELIEKISAQAGARIISVAPAAETRAMAEQAGAARMTVALGAPLSKSVESRFRIYPQLFVVDHGEVVRTCASVAECR